MNFQAVDQANGKNVTIWATMTEHLGVTQKDGKLKLKCKLTDDNGILHNVHIHKGNGELPDVNNLGQRMEFNLSKFQSTYDNKPYTGYSGFWSHGATKGSQSTPQSPQTNAQATNAPRKGSNDIEIRKWVTCAFLTWEKTPLVEDIEYWIEYIKTGVDASLPGEKTNEENNRQEDICPHCQKPLEDCTCDIPF